MAFPSWAVHGPPRSLSKHYSDGLPWGLGLASAKARLRGAFSYFGCHAKLR
jgi:hypothetical protein